jgi:hypothetical protein
MTLPKQYVTINGIEIEVPREPERGYEAPIHEIQEYIQAKELYEKRVSDATNNVPRLDALYAMDMDVLYQKAQQQHEEAENERIQKYHHEQSLTFLASEPRYIMTPENGRILAEEVQRRGLPGSVHDISQCFDYLAENGKIPFKYIPTVVDLHPNLSEKSLEELQALADAELRGQRQPNPFDGRR